MCICVRVYVRVCDRSPEFQNCKFFNSRGRNGDVDGGSPGKYLRLTYTNIAGVEECVFKNLHRYILIKVSQKANLIHRLDGICASSFSFRASFGPSFLVAARAPRSCGSGLLRVLRKWKLSAGQIRRSKVRRFLVLCR